MTETASALFWLPRIEEGLLPTPETVVVPYRHDQLMGYFDGEDRYPENVKEGKAELDATVAGVLKATKVVGIGAFVRTDLASAKHNGPESYRIQTPSDGVRVILDTFEDNELKFGIGGPTPAAFLVRQWLKIHHDFTAFGGHPIGREWRYFASASGVECRHFYWPEEAIRNPRRRDGAPPGLADWRVSLRRMTATEPPEELGRWALAAAGLMGDVEESWSVDFAQTTDGKWWLIDMAPGYSSWHPEHP